MDIKEKIQELIEPVLNRENYELVELQYRRERTGLVLRIFIDRVQGIILNDCVKVSEKLSQLLDEKDIIPERYTLEVSSPGLERILRKETDFQRFSGN